MSPGRELRNAFPGVPFFLEGTEREPGRTDLSLLIQPFGAGFMSGGSGDQTMTTHDNQIPEKKHGRTMRPVWDGILNAARSTPLRMPAGGWFEEVATNENWHTTTIIQRHSDQAAMTPSS